MMLMGEVEELCVRDGVVHVELFEYVFRSRIIDYYTNIDFEGGDLDEIWRFIGNDAIYDPIVANIADDVDRLRSSSYHNLSRKESSTDILAEKLLSVFGDVLDESSNLLAKLNESGIDAQQLIHLVTNDEGSGDES